MPGTTTFCTAGLLSGYDSFQGRGSQTFLYLGFDEGQKLYTQLDAFLKEHKISSEAVVGNDEVIQYLGGEAPSSIYDIVNDFETVVFHE